MDKKPVGTLTVEFFRGAKEMTNTHFDYYGELPEGSSVLCLEERALEAEELNRRFMDSVNGQVHMGEPFVPARQIPGEPSIRACAAMIKGICMTRPQAVWTDEIERRIRFMLKCANSAKE